MVLPLVAAGLAGLGGYSAATAASAPFINALMVGLGASLIPSAIGLDGSQEGIPKPPSDTGLGSAGGIPEEWQPRELYAQDEGLPPGVTRADFVPGKHGEETFFKPQMQTAAHGGYIRPQGYANGGDINIPPEDYQHGVAGEFDWFTKKLVPKIPGHEPTATSEGLTDDYREDSRGGGGGDYFSGENQATMDSAGHVHNWGDFLRSIGHGVMPGGLGALAAKVASNTYDAGSWGEGSGLGHTSEWSPEHRSPYHDAIRASEVDKQKVTGYTNAYGSNYTSRADVAAAAQRAAAANAAKNAAAANAAKNDAADAAKIDRDLAKAAAAAEPEATNIGSQQGRGYGTSAMGRVGINRGYAEGGLVGFANGGGDWDWRDVVNNTFSDVKGWFQDVPDPKVTYGGPGDAPPSPDIQQDAMVDDTHPASPASRPLDLGPPMREWDVVAQENLKATQRKYSEYVASLPYANTPSNRAAYAHAQFVRNDEKAQKLREEIEYWRGQAAGSETKTPLTSDSDVGNVDAFAIGGQIDTPQQDPLVQGAVDTPQQDPIVQGAIAAIMGNHPEPQRAVSAFINVHGQQAFTALRQEVLAAMSADQRDAGGLGTAGGMIRGPGTGTSDSIPGQITQGGVPVEDIRVANGEYILPERTTEELGGEEALDEIVRQTNGKEPGGRPIV